MSSEEFLTLLRKSGIPEGSKDLWDYEEAKHIASRVATEWDNYVDLLQACIKYTEV